MQKPNFYGAVYALIENEKGEMLFVKRQNTGYLDGYAGLPTGHVEGEETLKEAIIREVEEEVSLNLKESNLELVHISHRVSSSDRIYFDCYFHVKGFSGIPRNGESDKSTGIAWLDWRNSEKVQNKILLEEIFGGKTFSEIAETFENSVQKFTILSIL